MTDPVGAPDVELDHFYVTHEMIGGEVQAIWFGHPARADKREFICELNNSLDRATRIAAALNAVEGIDTELLDAMENGFLNDIFIDTSSLIKHLLAAAGDHLEA